MVILILLLALLWHLLVSAQCGPLKHFTGSAYGLRSASWWPLVLDGKWKKKQKTHVIITYCKKHSPWGYISLLNITYCRAMKNRRMFSETRSKFSACGWCMTAVYNARPLDNIWMPKEAKFKCNLPKIQVSSIIIGTISEDMFFKKKKRLWKSLAVNYLNLTPTTREKSNLYNK